jgi:hypothetical protein
MAGHADNMHVFVVRGPANEANFFTSGHKDTAVGAQADSLIAFDNEISFAPEANLVYIRRSGSTEDSSGSWRPYYLASGVLEDCCTDDEVSGYFEVGI